MEMVIAGAVFAALVAGVVWLWIKHPGIAAMLWIFSIFSE